MPLGRLVLLVAALLAASAALAPGSASALRWTKCPRDSHFECTWLRVPLDPSHVTPGTLKLRVKRLISTRARKRALIAMAGGPGQGATSAAVDFAITMGAAARRQRQLIVFDQRGTGLSGALNCPALQRRGDALDSEGAFLEVGTCGADLGPRRAFYTTTESVADIEALRKALNLNRVSLLGVSYGTYVAQRYAAAHPDHTERLILDSLVPQNGGDVFQLPSFRAVPRVLRELCRARACAGVTRDPFVDVGNLTARLRKSPLTGRIYDRRGRPRQASFGESSKLFDLLLAGDINPLLRVTLLAAVKAANAGDPAPLLRLDAISRYGKLVLTDDSNGLFVTTVCEESPVPWSSPLVPIADRSLLTYSALSAVPDLAVVPFDRQVALNAGAALLCHYWPQTAVAPVPAPATITAPTLVLSGRDDLRTPTEQAQAAMALLPNGSFVDVAGTGHSVMTADFTRCVERSILRFLSGKKVGDPCRGHSNTFLDPAPAPPETLSKVPDVPSLPRQGRAHPQCGGRHARRRRDLGAHPADQRPARAHHRRRAARRALCDPLHRRRRLAPAHPRRGAGAGRAHHRRGPAHQRALRRGRGHRHRILGPARAPELPQRRPGHRRARAHAHPPRPGRHRDREPRFRGRGRCACTAARARIGSADAPARSRRRPRPCGGRSAARGWSCEGPQDPAGHASPCCPAAPRRSTSAAGTCARSRSPAA